MNPGLGMPDHPSPLADILRASNLAIRDESARHKKKGGTGWPPSPSDVECRSAEQVLDGGAFLAQFLVGGVHARARKIVDLEALHDFVLAGLAGDGIAVDHAGLDAVGAIGRNA